MIILLCVYHDLTIFEFVCVIQALTHNYITLQKKQCVQLREMEGGIYEYMS